MTRKKAYNKDGTVSKKPNLVYLCAGCMYEFKKSEIHVDHIDPVGTTPEFPPPLPDTNDGWDEWLMRLWCDEHNLQVLCKVCHKKKTAAERKANVKKNP